MATSRARMRLRTLAWVVLAACAIAPVFNLLTDEATLGSAAQGLVDGLLAALLVGGWGLLVRDGLLRAYFRRKSFVANLALHGSAMLLLFLLARAVGQVVTTGDPMRFVRSFGDRHLEIALPFFFFAAFALQFLIQMNRMIGTNVLGDYVAGVYHRPKQEERIFLFLDLVGSTQLAERLGSARYYELLRQVVDDLSDPIVETGGEIYQYAGDLKQQIVFVGDILNTAARLEEYAKRQDLELAVSGPLLERLELPGGLRAHFLEQLTPRGKEQTIPVHALSGALG